VAGEPWSVDAQSWSAVGALVAAAGDPSRVTTSLTQLERAALAPGVASESDDLLSWNNDPNRTKQDVLGAFDLALASVDRLDQMAEDQPT
jgi:hypothetical protein